MIEQQGHAVWRGGLKEGSGSFSAGSLAGKYSFSSRFEGGAGSSPEELIGAAHASCFSMALSLFLGGHGHTPDTIETTRRFIWTHNGSS
ncbi:MAG: OsmC family peroxiredoxin [Gemmatimonadales bacterium]